MCVTEWTNLKLHVFSIDMEALLRAITHECIVINQRKEHNYKCHLAKYISSGNS